MCDEQSTKTPSQELAEQTANDLLKAKLIREKDRDELRGALGIGAATAEQWVSWLDLAMPDQGDVSDE